MPRSVGLAVEAYVPLPRSIGSHEIMSFVVDYRHHRAHAAQPRVGRA